MTYIKHMGYLTNIGGDWSNAVTGIDLKKHRTQLLQQECWLYSTVFPLLEN